MSTNLVTLHMIKLAEEAVWLYEVSVSGSLYEM